MTARTSTLLAAALGLGLAAGASAAPATFDLAWEGVGNGASATGSVTLDDAVFSAPAGVWYGSLGSGLAITAFEITVSGASVGDGTFGLSDFTEFGFFFTAPLDPTMELVGQPQASGVFGEINEESDFGFQNVIGSAAPVSVWYFTIQTNGGTGDELALTSMAPALAADVPLPATGLLLAAGLAGAAALRRRG
ncbi:PEP-CTERM sorting domain-containing protein [Rhodovulum sp. DZ06]|uniref:PEP-CTERM sorting domain-containing protein n=1 Tax=Rhodovulum sp. DZ06 TaxID=3425126 RepID=UPI003D3346C8